MNISHTDSDLKSKCEFLHVKGQTSDQPHSQADLISAGLCHVLGQHFATVTTIQTVIHTGEILKRAALFIRIFQINIETLKSQHTNLCSHNIYN